ncbi:hypothetical protein AAVH_12938 [Aphelenchoides avenae]|nr:hypothetical protein AAVH_12938 [Aphelenchus avenae]
MPLYWKSKHAFEDHSTTGILSAVSASKREEIHESVPTVLMTRLKLEEIKATHATPGWPLQDTLVAALEAIVFLITVLVIFCVLRWCCARKEKPEKVVTTARIQSIQQRRISRFSDGKRPSLFL